MTTTAKTAFCVQCRTMREVMDEYMTDTGDRYENVIYTYWARPLACGHDAGDGGSLPPPAKTPNPYTAETIERLTALQRGAK